MAIDLTGIYERAEAEANAQEKQFKEQLGNIKSRGTTEQFLNGLDEAYARREIAEREEAEAKAKADAEVIRKALARKEAHARGTISQEERENRDIFKDIVKGIGPDHSAEQKEQKRNPASELREMLDTIERLKNDIASNKQ